MPSTSAAMIYAFLKMGTYGMNLLVESKMREKKLLERISELEEIVKKWNVQDFTVDAIKDDRNVANQQPSCPMQHNDEDEEIDSSEISDSTPYDEVNALEEIEGENLAVRAARSICVREEEDRVVLILEGLGNVAQMQHDADEWVLGESMIVLAQEQYLDRLNADDDNLGVPEQLRIAEQGLEAQAQAQHFPINAELENDNDEDEDVGWEIDEVGWESDESGYDASEESEQEV